MIYSKKQLKPLIDKYSINVEEDELFSRVINLYPSSPNYQVWAISLVYGKNASYDDLVEINEWASKNKGRIRKLSNGNITSYKTKKDISQLKNEMKSVEMERVIKATISKFNTAQRIFLENKIFPYGANTLTDYKNRKLIKWYECFKKLNELPKKKLKVFFSESSLTKSANELYDMMKYCLLSTYEWNKDDFLSFVEENTTDTSVVFNNGNCVIAKVGSYEDAVKLCGGGRTKWCVCFSKDFFDDYVTMLSEQYFLFDFSRNESDPFAHVAFTISSGSGFVFAQTGENIPMICDASNGKETLNIWSLLDKVGVDLSIFIKEPSKHGLKWNHSFFKKLTSSFVSSYPIVYDKDGVIVVGINEDILLMLLTLHSLIDSSRYYFAPDEKVYLMIDTNVPYNDKNSLKVITYKKNPTGIYEPIKLENTFGEKIYDIDEPIINKLNKTVNGTDK